MKKLRLIPKIFHYKNNFLLLPIIACFTLSNANAGIKQINIDKEFLAPTLGSYGLDLSSMKKEVAIGDDFFTYVNGKWVDEYEIPADKSGYGSFYVLADKAEKDVQNIIKELSTQKSQKGSEEEKVGVIYSTYLNTDAIEKRGLKPIKKYLTKIAKVKTLKDVAKMMGQDKFEVSSPFAGFVGADFKNPDYYTLYLTQSGLGLPNKNYYLKEKFKDARIAYKKYIGTLLTLAGLVDKNNKEKTVKSIYMLEKKIAEAHWLPEQRRDREKTYNNMSVSELSKYAPGFAWKAFLQANGIRNIKRLVVRENTAFVASAEVFAQTEIADWVLYMQFHLLNNYADVLPKAFDTAKFEMYSKTLYGIPEQRKRWKRGISELNGALGEAIGKIYVKKHFPQKSKQQMEGLVNNLIKAYDKSIHNLDWMSDETKKEALKKLYSFTPKIGYPKKWRNYSALRVKKGKAFENDMAVYNFESKYMVAKINKKVDKDEWGMTPQTVNAYYNPSRNEIVFPAAILQAPFFDPEADDAVNYGGIGAVIGHEIGHGFDDQGRKTDGNGKLRNWWTKEDSTRFNKKTEALGIQYGKYEPVPGYKINPELTMGENIGDLGGAGIALKAYKMSLNGKEAPIIDGLTGTQRFFYSWAQVWRSKYRKEATISRITTDPHSPPHYRVNGVVRNLDEWYEAFDIDENAKMYLPKEQRVTIW